MEYSRLNSFTDDQLHSAYAVAYRKARSRLQMIYNSHDTVLMDMLLSVHTLNTDYGYEVVPSATLEKLHSYQEGNSTRKILSKAIAVDNPYLCSIPQVGYSLTPKGREYVLEFLSILKVCKEEFLLTIEKDIADRAEKALNDARKKSAARSRRYRASKGKRS